MSKKRAKKNNNLLLENVKISDIAAEGKSIARVDDMVVFVSYTIPEDVVDIRVIKKRKNYMEGVVVNMVQASPNAQAPFCKHFGECGGCKWQRLPYVNQLQYKQKQVIDQLTRIGQLAQPEVLPTFPSEKTLYYRNKLEYTFSNKRWLTKQEVESGTDINESNGLGFHIPERFDKVLDIETCYLQPNPSNDIRLAVRRFALDNNYEFFDLRNKSGFLRNLIIRTSTTGEVMLIVVFYYDDEEKRIDLLNHLQKMFPQITSLQYVINSKANDSIADQDVVLFAGKPYITEVMEGLQFRVGPKSFYQTNPEQAYQLYCIARDYAALTGNEVVYDLYTGTGTIANFVARKASKVIGVEYVKEAIDDARINSEINGIDNTLFFAGDMKDVLTSEFIAENGQPDVIILDPPRAGIHANVVDTLLNVLPKRIVYISCNPATQARDIALLSAKYKHIKSQPVDMFPHTHHIENVTLLERI